MPDSCAQLAAQPAGQPHAPSPNQLTHACPTPTPQRYVLCDAKLKALFGEDRVLAFSFQKHLGQHIIKDA